MRKRMGMETEQGDSADADVALAVWQSVWHRRWRWPKLGRGLCGFCATLEPDAPARDRAWRRDLGARVRRYGYLLRSARYALALAPTLPVLATGDGERANGRPRNCAQPGFLPPEPAPRQPWPLGSALK